MLCTGFGGLWCWLYFSFLYRYILTYLPNYLAAFLSLSFWRVFCFSQLLTSRKHLIWVGRNFSTGIFVFWALCFFFHLYTYTHIYTPQTPKAGFITGVKHARKKLVKFPSTGPTPAHPATGAGGVTSQLGSTPDTISHGSVIVRHFLVSVWGTPFRTLVFFLDALRRIIPELSLFFFPVGTGWKNW